MIFGVRFKVGGEAFNLFGEKRNLDLRGSSIDLMHTKLLNYFAFAFCLLHVYPFLLLFFWVSFFNTPFF